MNKLSKKLFILATTGLFLFAAGCASGKIQAPESKQQAVGNTMEQKLMNDFTVLVGQNAAIQDVIRFIDDNLASMPQDKASAMINELEKMQQAKLPALQDKFGDNEALQKALAQTNHNGVTNQTVNGIGDQPAKALLEETLRSGYKVETAEGMFFPVIDYTAYKKYSLAVTPDMAAYIEIRAVETEKTPVKDAALVISWDDVVKRGLIQERFLKQYPNTAKAEDIKRLLKQYTVFAMYGANNTPLFDYQTHQIVPKAKDAYIRTDFNPDNGIFSKAMSEYLELLKNNEYLLTPQIQEYRNQAVEAM